jgi:hypothetical protein
MVPYKGPFSPNYGLLSRPLSTISLSKDYCIRWSRYHQISHKAHISPYKDSPVNFKMFNFNDNHKEQTLAHYGLSTGGAPRTSGSIESGRSMRSESRGWVPPRKPLNAASRLNQQSLYPHMTPTTPRRTPAGDDRTRSPARSHANSRAPSPAPANRKGPSDLMKPLPSIPRVSSRKPESRPTTPSGGGFRGRKRNDSIASISSSVFDGFRSRNGSISESVKSVGKWAKGKADIITMTSSEREAFVEGARKNQEREVEQARQQDPYSRPVYQQQFLAQKYSPGVPWGEAGSKAVYEAYLEEHAARVHQAEAYRLLHQKACEQAESENKPRPDTPEEAKLSPPTSSLNSSERAFARNTFNGSDFGSDGLGAGDRLAMKISRKLDAFKRNRKGSDSSDMDFADCAPIESMFICGDGHMDGMGCGLPFTTYLKENLCVDCHAWVKNKGTSRVSS